jgi:hypothetical protein
MTLKSRLREFLRNFKSRTGNNNFKFKEGWIYIILIVFILLLSFGLLFYSVTYNGYLNDIPIEGCCTTYTDKKGEIQSCNCAYNLGYREFKKGECGGKDDYEYAGWDKNIYLDKITKDKDFPLNDETLFPSMCGTSIRDIIDEDLMYFTPLYTTIAIIICWALLGSVWAFGGYGPIFANMLMIVVCGFGFYIIGTTFSNFDNLNNEQSIWEKKIEERDDEDEDFLGYELSDSRVSGEVLKTSDHIRDYIKFTKNCLIISTIIYCLVVVWSFATIIEQMSLVNAPIQINA